MLLVLPVIGGIFRFGLLTTGFVEIPLLFITLVGVVVLTEFLKLCILNKYSVQSVQSFQSIADGNDKNGLLLPIGSSTSNCMVESGLKASAFVGNNPLSVDKYSANCIESGDDDCIASLVDDFGLFTSGVDDV